MPNTTVSFVVTLYGAVGDGVANDSPALTTVAGLGSGIVFFPAGTYRLAADVVFPHTQSLQFAPGAILVPDSSKKVTVRGSLELTPINQQIFGGAGTVDIRNNAVYSVTDKPTISVQWFGAKGDGANDDTAAIQACFNQFNGQSNLTAFNITIPSGIYKVTSTLLILGNVGSSLTLHGTVRPGFDLFGATFQWLGPIGGTVIEARGIDLCYFHDFAVDGNNLAHTGLWVHSDQAAGGPGADQCTFERLLIKACVNNSLSGSDGYESACLLIGDNPSGPQYQVDEMWIKDCYFQGGNDGVHLTKSGIKFWNSGNCKIFYIEHCGFESAVYGVNCFGRVTLVTAHKCEGSGIASLFQVGSQNSISINHCEMEGTGGSKFIDSIGAAQNANLSLKGNVVYCVSTSNSWTAGHAYPGYHYVQPRRVHSNGSFYITLAGGTSGGTEPAWNATLGSITHDGTINWVNAGTVSIGQPGLTPDNVDGLWLCFTGNITLQDNFVSCVAEGGFTGYYQPTMVVGGVGVSRPPVSGAAFQTSVVSLNNTYLGSTLAPKILDTNGNALTMYGPNIADPNLDYVEGQRISITSIGDKGGDDSISNVFTLPTLMGIGPVINSLSGKYAFIIDNNSCNTYAELSGVVRDVYVVPFNSFSTHGAVATYTTRLAGYKSGTVVDRIIADVSGFTIGGGATLSMSVGSLSTGTSNCFLKNCNALVTASYGLADADLGSDLARATAVQGGGTTWYATTGQLAVTLTSSLSNLNTLSAGSIVLRVLTKRLSD